MTTENAELSQQPSPLLWSALDELIQPQDIGFAIGTCSLGCILVAVNTSGVCWLAMGDSAAQLLVELQLRFPKAALVTDKPLLMAILAKVLAVVDCPTAPFDLPLAGAGTDFQKKVWQCLQTIPVGATRSYSDVAAQIGMPKAVRAVAGACAANPLAVLVPCHRVVGRDGSLSGYRWGVERKRQLLAREAGLE